MLNIQLEDHYDKTYHVYSFSESELEEKVQAYIREKTGFSLNVHFSLSEEWESLADVYLYIDTEDLDEDQYQELVDKTGFSEEDWDNREIVSELLLEGRSGYLEYQYSGSNMFSLFVNRQLGRL